MKQRRGFTLVELMIVVAVVAILSTVGYPYYQEHVSATRRSAAQAVMLEMAAREHQWMLDVRSYRAGSPADLGVAMPDDLANSYVIEATVDLAARPPTFTITARPAARQARDKCGTMTVTHTNVRTPASGCW